ncbi:LacI family DNA-binding transcriptional regulator [Melioribacteraceae bacterium 4301-Me]|uniref:LacI family DNA-binding transcriptional regulator n=1 Tax=Pyranulibacter aquaticus TaxID=3163344 RepID=UPI00359759BC
MAKRVTLKNIADTLNISMMTVSRALNNQPNVDEETKERVIKTARQLGYFPNQIAKSLVIAKTQTIGVVVPEITHSFFPDAIKGIEEVVYKAGYNIILTHSAEDTKREISAIETLASRRVDGILASVAESDTEYQIYKQIIDMGLHVVFFDRCVYNIGASCVSVNDEESAFKITEHLIKHKYKKIAHLRGPLSISIARERLEGFKRALQKYKIKYNESWIVESGFHEDGGYKAMNKLFELPRKNWPRAVVAVNDPAAFGAMKAVKEKGLNIPQDIAIVGFSDDIRAELMWSPLTTVKQNAYEVGKLAAQKLIAHIHNKKEKVENIVVKTELVIRNSCGCKYKLGIRNWELGIKN